MAFSQDMVYIRYEFAWENTEEIQDTGLWCFLEISQGATLDWQEAVQAIADKAVDAWASNWNKVRFSRSVVGTRAIAYHYDQPLKKVLHRGEAGFTGDTAWRGTATNDLPPENTLALSLYTYEPGTYVQNAPRRRGRMYLPTLSFDQLGGTFYMNATQRGAWLDDASAWLADLQGQIQVPANANLRPQVVSRGGKDGTAAEANHEVTWLRLGRLVDTQRRRRNRLAEEYVDRAL